MERPGILKEVEGKRTLKNAAVKQIEMYA